MEIDAIMSKLINHTPTIMGSNHSSKYAVMIPLIQKEDGIHVLFEVRSLSLRRQPGEICFPGGKIDYADADEKAAAIRETTEELGIRKEEIKGVRPLDFMMTPFGMIVYPFVGLITSPEDIQLNPDEVGELFMVPLHYFMTTNPEIYKINFKVEPEEKFPFHLIAGGENYQWRTRNMDEYFYLYNDKVIWGLTAKILSQFIEILR